MADALAITLASSEARTASGVSAAIDIGKLRRVAELVLDVTEVSGDDPSLEVVVETSLTLQEWSKARTFERQTENGTCELFAFGLKRYVRVRWTIGGTTPSFTFSVAGVAEVVYCEPRDVTLYAVPEHSIERITAEDRWRACLAATAKVETYVRAAYTTPLLSWDLALRVACAWIAAAMIFAQRGLDPQSPDQTVLDERDAQIKWLEKLADGRADADIVDSTTEVFEGGAVVVSNPSRGW